MFGRERGYGGLLVVLAATCAPLAGDARELTQRGVYRVEANTGRVDYVGPYRYPSVSPDSRLLYADDGQGGIVCWPLDTPSGAPRVFLTTPVGEPRRAVPLAAPAGGHVALTRLMGERGALRVTLEVYDRSGTRQAGPLPLFAAATCHNRNLAAAWHPEGDRLAFCVAAGRPRPGVYVMTTPDHNWVQATTLGRPLPNPLPVLRWQPDGRSLSLVLHGQLQIRSGAPYEVLHSWPVSGWLHTWLDGDGPALLDAAAGMVLHDLAGNVRRSLPFWRAASADQLSLPVANAAGVAWVGPASETPQRHSLYYLPKGVDSVRELLSFAPGRQPYGRQAGGPVWQADQAVLFVDVP